MALLLVVLLQRDEGEDLAFRLALDLLSKCSHNWENIKKEFFSSIRDPQLLDRNSAYLPCRILCWDVVSSVFLCGFLSMWIMGSILGPEVCSVALIFQVKF